MLLRFFQSFFADFVDLDGVVTAVERDNEFEANSDDEMDANLFDSIKNLDDQGLLPLDER